MDTEAPAHFSSSKSDPFFRTTDPRKDFKMALTTTFQVPQDLVMAEEDHHIPISMAPTEISIQREVVSFRGIFKKEAAGAEDQILLSRDSTHNTSGIKILAIISTTPTDSVITAALLETTARIRENSSSIGVILTGVQIKEKVDLINRTEIKVGRTPSRPMTCLLDCHVVAKARHRLFSIQDEIEDGDLASMKNPRIKTVLDPPNLLKNRRLLHSA